MRHSNSNVHALRDVAKLEIYSLNLGIFLKRQENCERCEMTSNSGFNFSQLFSSSLLPTVILSALLNQMSAKQIKTINDCYILFTFFLEFTYCLLYIYLPNFQHVCFFLTKAQTYPLTL